MEIAAAAGSAATIVQLVDFAGRLLIASTSFFAAVTEASKELQALHCRIQHLEKLFENTRALACSYQNSKLAITPQNQDTLELLGEALTICSKDLQSLNDVLQRPLEQTEWGIVRFKRRIRHVFDEGILRRLSLRLEGDINLINGLLSGINMHNGSVIHGSIERVAELIGSLPPVSAEPAHQQGTKSIVDRLEEIVDRLDQVDRELAKSQQITDSEPDDFGIDPLVRNSPLEIAAIRTDDLIPSLELFLPAFRAGLQFLYKDSGAHISKEATYWLSSEFYDLIGEVYTAAARSQANFLTERQKSDIDGEALMPRRFHRLTDLPKSPLKESCYKQLSTSQEVAGLTSCIHAEHADILRCDGRVSTSSGRLYSYFEGTHWSKEWSFCNSESGRVSMAFVPKLELGLPGIGVSFMKQHGYSHPCHQSFLSTFNILPVDAPIIQEVKDGDCGVSRVLQKLKAGEAWAGDRDENGRSLLSYAVESGSRDMCALLFRMGAHPQDVHSMLQLQFAPVKQQHIPMWSARRDDR